MTPELRAQALSARILIVDDVEENVLLVQNLLRQHGFTRVHATTDPRTVVGLHQAEPFDLILLDLQMPYLDGLAVMERLKALGATDFLPVIVITAYTDEAHRLAALRMGARDYVLKPFVAAEVLQRIENFLEVQLLYRERARQAEVLERRVREQVAQLERLSRLKRFFSPQLAESILAGGVDDPLRTHRREITALSVDLRGFTAFTEAAEPEEVMDVLHEYHARMGRLIVEHEGTIEYFAGDGIMVIFNDPVPIPDAARRAVAMALEMQAAFEPLAERWRARGFDIGMGIGIAEGYATIGAIGFEGRWDYAAIGSVTNLSARLCAEAKPGEILVCRKVQARIAQSVRTLAKPELSLKGFPQPVTAYAVQRSETLAGASAMPLT